MGDKGAGPSRIVAYSSEQDVEGQVTLAMPPGKKMDHLGIRVKFFGRIDMVSRWTRNREFLLLC